VISVGGCDISSPLVADSPQALDAALVSQKAGAGGRAPWLRSRMWAEGAERGLP
jgi:hypothetical protein